MPFKFCLNTIFIDSNSIAMRKSENDNAKSLKIDMQIKK